MFYGPLGVPHVCSGQLQSGEAADLSLKQCQQCSSALVSAQTRLGEGE